MSLWSVLTDLLNSQYGMENEEENEVVVENRRPVVEEVAQQTPQNEVVVENLQPVIEVNNENVVEEVAQQTPQNKGEVGSQSTNSSEDNNSEQSKLEEDIQEIEKESIKTISLSGRELMEDLKDAMEAEIRGLSEGADIDVNAFSDKLTQRFIKTVSIATTGFGRESSLFAKGQEILNDINGDPSKFARYQELTDFLTDIEEKYREIKKKQLSEKTKKDSSVHENELEELKKNLFESFPELGAELEQVNLSEEQKEEITNLIKQATTKLAEELKKEKEVYYLWQSTNSLTAANKERSFLNIFGHMYDCIGSVCHKVAVTLGLKDKNAADLFAEVADHAKAIHEKLSSTQLERDAENKGKSKHYGFNRKNMEKDQDVLEQKIAEKNQETMDKTIEELGNLLRNKYKTPKELNEALLNFREVQEVNDEKLNNVEKLQRERASANQGEKQR